MGQLKKYKNQLAFLSIIGFLCAGSITLMYRYNPERRILGDWQETGWSYENVDTESFIYHDVKLGRKHESESWKFARGKKLYFYNGNDTSAVATWKLKGRGHILQIIYEDGDQELYDIKELDEHRLELNFDIGIESRGIARLVFIRKDMNSTP